MASLPDAGIERRAPVLEILVVQLQARPKEKTWVGTARWCFRLAGASRRTARDLMPAPHGAEDGALTGSYGWRENQCVSCTEGAPHHWQATHNAKPTTSTKLSVCNWSCETHLCSVVGRNANKTQPIACAHFSFFQCAHPKPNDHPAV